VTNVVYANRQVPGAIIAVPTTTFVQSQPVGRSAVRMTREMVASAPVAAVAVVAPTEKSVRGAAVQGDKPPARVFERPVVARTAPPAAPAGFAAQKQQLEAKPGKPLDENVRKELKSAAAAPAPIIKVVAQPKAVPPTTLPPAAATAARAPDGRGKSDVERKGAPAPATAGAPIAPTTQATPPARVAQPAVIARPPEARAKVEQRGKGEERDAPVAARPPAPQPQVARPAATPLQPAQQAKPEPAPVAKEMERRPPAAPPKLEAAPVAKQPERGPPVAVAKPLPPETQRAPKAEPADEKAKPAAGKADERKSKDEQKREEEDRKQKG